MGQGDNGRPGAERQAGAAQDAPGLEPAGDGPEAMVRVAEAETEAPAHPPVSLSPAEMRLEQSEQLLEIARQALAAWERSGRDEETITVTSGRVRTTRDGGQLELPDQVVVQRRARTGEAAFLAQALHALAAFREIWGLNAPKRQDLTSGGEPIKAYVAIDVERV